MLSTVSKHLSKCILNLRLWESPSLIRNIGKRNVSRKSLVMSNHGEPMQVLELVEDEIKELGSDDILLKVLLAPINPGDINTIQGSQEVIHFTIA